MLLLLTSAGARGATVDRKIVFLLDHSKSMYSATYPGGGARRQTFEQEARAAADTADRLCQEVERYGDTAVSFYTFGERDSLRPSSPDALSMTPAQARPRLPELFSTDRNRYDQNRTYIAYSIFNLVKRELGLPASFSHKDVIPEDAKLLNVFVFTDGDEDVEEKDKADNELYREWLKRNERRLQIRWQIWRLFPRTDAEKKERDDSMSRPADSVLYTVHFGVPSTAYSFSAQEPPSNRSVELQVPRLIRLIPPLSGGSQTGGSGDCTAGSPGPIQPVPAGRMLVQSGIEWPAHSAATTEWAINTPARELVDGINPATGLRQPQLGRGVLRLLIDGSTSGVIEPDVAPGAYPVRLNQKELCDELQRAYPNSTFVFPTDEQGRIPPLGHIQVDNIPTYTFLLTVQEATAPNGAIGALNSDRFLRYDRVVRTYRLTAPEGVTGSVAATVNTRYGGKPLQSASDIVQLSTHSAIPFGAPFTLAVPAEEQHWWKSLFYFGFRRPAGDYDLTLKVRPQIASTPHAPYKVHLLCQNCDPARVQYTGEELRLMMPFRVEPRKCSWLEIAAALALLVTLIWAIVRWRTRPQFPTGLVIGKVQGYADLRSAHADGLTGKLSLFWRRPVYLEMLSGGKTVLFHEPFLAQDPKADAAVKRKRNLIGVRPEKNNIEIWCVSASTQDCIVLRGRPLATTHADPPTGHKDVAQIRYVDIEKAASPIGLEVEETIDKVSTKTSYYIQRLRV